MGQPRRQLPGPRRHLPEIRAGLHGALRAGGRDGRRRAAPHRYGRRPGKPQLEPLPARPRALARPAVHAVEPRNRHQDGRVAPAQPGGRHAGDGRRPQGRRHRGTGRHAPRAAPRRDGRGRPRHLQHAERGGHGLPALRLVRRHGADAGGGPRPGRARAGHRTLDHAAVALGRRPGRRPQVRQDQGRVRRDPGVEVTGRRTTPSGRGSWSTRPIGSRRASPASTSSAWRAGAPAHAAGTWTSPRSCR